MIILACKYANDMAMVGLMARCNREQERTYFEHIDHLVAWCGESALFLNSAKTKELFVSAGGGQPSCQPVTIGGPTGGDGEQF